MTKSNIESLIYKNRSEVKDGNFVTYIVKSKTTLHEAAKAIAIGQSIGNPNKRSEFETDKLIEKFCCKIISVEETNKSEGKVVIFYPDTNFNYKEDGISHFLTTLMGGQLDIDIIEKCRLEDIEFSLHFRSFFSGPNLGLNEIRKLTNTYNKPLFGGIIKPKIGLNAEDYFEVFKIYADNGCNFIKEDEILSNQSFCSIRKRLERVANYIRTNNIKLVYCPSITCDHKYLESRVEKIEKMGINGVHINIHSGYGAYKLVKDSFRNIYLHYQKSGDRLWTNPQHNFSINETVLFEIASRCGCSTLHVGMIGGYLNSDSESLKRSIKKLVELNSVSALSCGLHPGLIDYITNELGHVDWMGNVGGSISSHPMGAKAGVKAMVQAINKVYGEEYNKAIEVWGKK